MTECRATLSATAKAKGKIFLPDEAQVPVFTFLGIPFAQPPVGKFRFMPPQPCELWSGERDCTTFGPMSIQAVEPMAKGHFMFADYPKETSEDCLYLNIYTPSLNPRDRLPVMVWFHGGGFNGGTANVYDGSALASFHNVIVVTVNYRVGPLGFMTTGDDVIPGNNGQFDQLEALRWIQKNIVSFRGNPDNVTIFGQSAGAMSCALHVISDMAVGLFHRAIIQSGPVMTAFCCERRESAREKLQPKLEAAGYTGSTSQDLLAFLQTKTAEEINNIDETMSLSKPVIDGHYLTDFPHKLYNAGEFSRVPIMIGGCSHEGYGSCKHFLAADNLPLGKDDLVGYIKAVVPYCYTENHDAISNAIYDHCVKDECIDNLDLFKRRYCDLNTDMFLTATNYEMAEKHSVKAPVYLYIYDYRGTFSKDDEWVGAIHGDDLHPTLGLCYTRCLKDDIVMTDADKQVMKMVMTYWTNFAKTGNPNSTELVTWKPYTQDNKACMLLNDKPAIASDVLNDRIACWTNDILKLDTGRE